MKVIFMGTPDFAEEVLKTLISSEHEVVAVFTQPDRPKGRKLVLTESPVKTLAKKHEIEVFCPQSLKSGEVAELIAKLNPDAIVVAAYGLLLPEEILKIPKYGCINVHASLLPKYRGAAPIQWALINGEPETGVSIMQMDRGLDSGDIICQKSLKISDEDSANSLFVSLAKLGSKLLLSGLELLQSPGFKAQPQNPAEVTFAPMLTKELRKLDFSKPARQVFNLVRGLDRWPVATAEIGGKIIKVLSARVAAVGGLGPGELAPGKRLIVGCKDGAVELLTVAPENGKQMPGTAFVCGYL